MIYDAVSYPQNRLGLPVFGGVVLLHGLVLAGMLHYQSAAVKPEMTVAMPLTVRWVTPVEDPKPEPVVEPQPVAEAEPESLPLPPPEVKKPSPVKVKPKPLKKPKPVVTQAPLQQKPIVTPAVSAPVQPAKPAPVKAETASAPVEAPRFNAAYLSNPAPVYPRRSRMLEEEGIVKLRVHVSTVGKALSVQLFKSSGFSRLDDAALTAVRNWRFVPAKQGNQSIEGWVIVPVSFKLRS
ncbi:energy transducer TonB [Tolumonas osonensis]|uniref:Protein TonB n=1 Tax=Tolumonas osonensis TaxID=675874 RepID=A0A841GJ97_9GAMM|nr:energy transducer TonB [Tolumonas osonensis]MBB6054920.1 protein TonB [Tolumonas osonensis]